MDNKITGPRILKIPVGKIKDVMMARSKSQDNAKVKVQYIQSIHKKPALKSTDSHKYTIDRTEVESVEYLDENITEDQTTLKASDFNFNTTEKEYLIDEFYPNAIHCLIALYKNKYLEMKGKTDQQIRAMHIWDQITREMNESYFTFNRSQIKEQFIRLRAQYFGVSSIQSINHFEYFDQLHDIYHDKYINDVLEGKYNSDNQLQREYIYRDDNLQLEEEPRVISFEESENSFHAKPQDVVEIQENDIAHKEHEFIDMVEKELQALEGSRTERTIRGTSCDKSVNKAIMQTKEETIEQEHGHETQEQKLSTSSPVRMIIIKRSKNEESDSNPLHVPKRLKSECKTPLKIGPCINLGKTIIQSSKTNDVSVDTRELTLAEYNAQQERRHQEKMELLRQNLAMQERALEIQSNLMEELLKRL